MHALIAHNIYFIPREFRPHEIKCTLDCCAVSIIHPFTHIPPYLLLFIA